MPSKKQIRNTMKKRRSELSSREVRARSERIIARLTGQEVYRRAGCLASYVSIANEVDTLILIDFALDSGKRVGVPVVKPNRTLIHREVRSRAELKPSGFGLLEPSLEDGAVVPPDAFDVVLVPGLAFDRAGNRVGFGAGFYDRFLSFAPAFKIGLAYDFQLFDRLPAGPRDIPMDFVVTESGIHDTSAVRKTEVGEG
ncbi:MAG: 5-formyltetrahydrofolate cyclo-ligase [Gemmatimonadetes bacterium]|nr:5-formyltetrahydrofolate cyclo-ligase [Gemmatimonadota bacterium]